jgi:hypothetical protein
LSPLSPHFSGNFGIRSWSIHEGNKDPIDSPTRSNLQSA